MKKLLLLLLFPLFVSGQNIERYVSFTASIDAVNAIKGSEPTKNKSELDVNLSAGIHLGKGITWNFNYESFKAIGFYKLACGAGYVFEPIPKLRVHIIGLTELIFRRGTMVEKHFQHNDKFIGLSVNLQAGYEISPGLYVGGTLGGQMRGDLKDAGYKDYFKINGAITVEYLIYID